MWKFKKTGFAAPWGIQATEEKMTREVVHQTGSASSCIYKRNNWKQQKQTVSVADETPHLLEGDMDNLLGISEVNHCRKKSKSFQCSLFILPEVLAFNRTDIGYTEPPKTTAISYKCMVWAPQRCKFTTTVSLR